MEPNQAEQTSPMPAQPQKERTSVASETRR
ncbi:hypothetical protein NIES4075_71460 [Tolypothrix sp. NIES-4075]|nr:hypothetical protein NIES4075_71460 [Tolypothrix sp. NIES-4075]